MKEGNTRGTASASSVDSQRTLRTSMVISSDCAAAPTNASTSVFTERMISPADKSDILFRMVSKQEFSLQAAFQMPGCIKANALHPSL